MSAAIDILLSTYNGEKYLREQLDSIVRQTEQDWRIIVRDDGSTDTTISTVLKEYQASLGEKLQIISGENLGVVGSFSRLVEQSAAPYLMFCDQDDVWLESKIEIMLDSIKRAEADAGQSKPVLVFSDLALMTEQGLPMKVGFWERHGVNPDHVALNRLLLQNVVTGCACMFNRALIQKALPIPKEAVMHDWWFALNAALFGKLVAIKQKTVLYRQHAGNQVGARGINLGRIQAMLRDGESVKHRLEQILLRASAQASALLSVHGNELSERQKKLVADFARISNMGWLSRKRFFIRENVLFSNRLRNLCLLIC